MKRITEHDEVDYSNSSQLSYYDDGSNDVELYVDGEYVGTIEVWTDRGVDDLEIGEREYLCINHEIVYLEDIYEL